MNTPHWEIVTQQPCTLGESPFWHPQEQRLYWVDILGNQIHRLHWESRVQESWEMPQEACCIAPARSGGLVIALRDGFYRGRHWGGDVTPLATVGTGHFDFDPKITRFNDGKCDPLGRFWCGTMCEPRTASSGQLFSLEMVEGRAHVELQASGTFVSNGLAFALDRSQVYWSDSFGHVLYSFDWEADRRKLTHQRRLIDFPHKDAAMFYGRPDGATMDAQGRYYVCLMEGGAILQLLPTPEPQLLMSIRIATPVSCPTMPCFGGPDLKTLFVTSLRENRTPEQLSAEPHLGHVFAMQTNTAGVPVDFFND